MVIGRRIITIATEFLSTTAALVNRRNIDWTTLNPKVIQFGTASVEAKQSNSTGGKVSVTFSQPFDNVPYIFTSVDAFSVFGFTVQTSDKTATGFALNSRHTSDSGGSAGNINVSWVAIDMTKFSA